MVGSGGKIIINQYLEGSISIMVVVKWSDKVEGLVDNIYAPFCGVLYKKEDISLAPWSVIDTNFKMNCFTCSKEDNYFIVPEDHYNE